MKPHLASVGEMLLEARCQLTHKEFRDWIGRNFKMSMRQAEDCIDQAYAARRKPNGGVMSKTTKTTSDLPPLGSD
jgi:hypothetical protein